MASGVPRVGVLRVNAQSDVRYMRNANPQFVIVECPFADLRWDVLHDVVLERMRLNVRVYMQEVDARRMLKLVKYYPDNDDAQLLHSTLGWLVVQILY